MAGLGALNPGATVNTHRGLIHALPSLLQRNLWSIRAHLSQLGGAPISYLLGAEIPNATVREKTQSLGAAWNVV
ncbi:hypothetical protein BDW66DRAFT_155412 [Aspergillus desertorum]